MKYTKVILAVPTCRPNIGMYNTKAAFATPECRSKWAFITHWQYTQPLIVTQTWNF